MMKEKEREREREKERNGLKTNIFLYTTITYLILLLAYSLHIYKNDCIKKILIIANL
jgi:hypothetical protein